MIEAPRREVELPGAGPHTLRVDRLAGLPPELVEAADEDIAATQEEGSLEYDGELDDPAVAYYAQAVDTLARPPEQQAEQANREEEESGSDDRWCVKDGQAMWDEATTQRWRERDRRWAEQRALGFRHRIAATVRAFTRARVGDRGQGRRPRRRTLHRRPACSPGRPQPDPPPARARPLRGAAA